VIDEAWLARQVGRTSVEIAAEIGCDISIVVAAMTELGMPGTRRTLPELRSRQWLNDHRHLTRDELAALLGCHPVTAVHAFAAAGITRTASNVARRYPQLADRRWLARRSRRSAAEVAAEIGCPRDAMTAARRRHQLTGPSRRPAELDRPAWLRSARRRPLTELAKELGCSPGAVANACRRHGITRPAN
jgi:AraC-like DNA-binding protein